VNTVENSVQPHTACSTRPVWPALRRGFAGRCPRCGEGALFCGYLKVAPACTVCHQAFHHHRADDAPPYVTILVVGHIIGAAMLAVEEANDALPLWIHMLVWPVLTLVLCLALLPRAKGALIALQWAHRMHGFGLPVTSDNRTIP
jgi:uncharacterized protein (DUF983 family)